MTNPFAKYLPRPDHTPAYRDQLLGAFAACLEDHPYGNDRQAIEDFNFPHGGTFWCMIEDHLEDATEEWWHTHRCDQQSIIDEAINAHTFGEEE
jgi:hypothetical protein